VLAAKVETFNRRYHQSITFAAFALKNIKRIDFDLGEAVHWETIQGVIDTLIQLIDENLGGKADRKQIEKKKCINALDSILGVVGDRIDTVIHCNERVVRLIANAYKVVGEETMKVEMIKRAINIIKRLLKETKVKESSIYMRGLKLDLARLFHLADLLFPKETDLKFKDEKI